MKKTSFLVEHKTCDILAAERLRLMRFDNRLIIDFFPKSCMYTQMVIFDKETNSKGEM